MKQLVKIENVCSMTISYSDTLSIYCTKYEHELFVLLKQILNVLNMMINCILMVNLHVNGIKK